MKNRYMKRARISERKFREVLKLYAADLPALTTAKLTGLNYRTVHRIYHLLRERTVELTLNELKPFAGEIEVDESYFGARRVRELAEKRRFWVSTNGETGSFSAWSETAPGGN